MDNLNGAILEELKKITKLLSLLNIKDSTNQREQIAKLNSSGFQPKEIAEMLNTTPGTVSTALTNLRKNQKTRKAKKK